MQSNTREKILDATIRLFNELGPMVPMSKISEAAGVAAGTPFRYFSTKEELLQAAYHEAFAHTLRYEDEEEVARMMSGATPEQVVKHIVRTVMKWAALYPQELEYMRKYEDTVCYDCFSETFSEKLYVGIIREKNLWPLLQNAVRPDLPEELLNRVISINCTVYARYISHLGLTVEDPAFTALTEASADSIWNSIKA